jgi:hypothetical protein
VPEELIPITAIIVGGMIAIFVPLVRAWSKKIEMQGRVSLPDPEVAARLERIERTVESIAVEIERVSEGQRFTTRLLSERAALPSSERGTAG